MLISITISISYYLPYFILGNNYHVLIHDNLDSSVVWAKLLGENGGFFAAPNQAIPQFLEGITRSSISSYYNPSEILFGIIDSYWAYAINKILIGLTAFIGSYYLSKHLIPSASKYTAPLAALFYSILPFWGFSLSIASVPALFVLFYKAYQQQLKVWHIGLAILLSISTSLIISGIFIHIILTLIGSIKVFKSKQINYQYWGLIALTSVVMLLNHFPSIYGFIGSENPISHRVEFTNNSSTFSEAFYQFDWVFRKGQYHSLSVHQFIIPFIFAYLAHLYFNFSNQNKLEKLFLPIVALITIVLGVSGYSLTILQATSTPHLAILPALLISIFNTKKLPITKVFLMGSYVLWLVVYATVWSTLSTDQKIVVVYIPILTFTLITSLSKQMPFIPRGFFLFLILSSLVYGLLNWELVTPFYNQYLAYIPIQIQRFHVIQPVVWVTLFSLGISTLLNQFKLAKTVAIALVIFQTVVLFEQIEHFANKNTPNFKDFYSVNLFTQVKSDINESQTNYKIINIGMEPSIAHYNGFYTLDGYMTNYPLDYKHKFRKIIEGELNKSDDIKNYFDNWGSRCYAFSAELGLDYESPQSDSINFIDYDFDLLKKMDCKYVFSRAPINTKNNPDIELFKEYLQDDYHWKLWVYQLK